MTVREAKRQVESSLREGDSPSLIACTIIRKSGEKNCAWLDESYLKFKRPELMGNDLDGLCAVLACSETLRNKLADCSKKEVGYWVKVIKHILPLPRGFTRTSLGVPKLGS